MIIKIRSHKSLNLKAIYVSYFLKKLEKFLALKYFFIKLNLKNLYFALKRANLLIVVIYLSHSLKYKLFWLSTNFLIFIM